MPDGCTSTAEPNKMSSPMGRNRLTVHTSTTMHKLQHNEVDGKSRQKDRQRKGSACVWVTPNGNRTRAACLEGKHDNHFTISVTIKTASNHPRHQGLPRIVSTKPLPSNFYAVLFNLSMFKSSDARSLQHTSLGQ